MNSLIKLLKTYIDIIKIDIEIKKCYLEIERIKETAAIEWSLINGCKGIGNG